ncbi:uncharacterized protein [Palaemon carinicauda]|uniref:uncharacterized protein n=1 Tax=Palaemon carinicauda TaxID=392227 RepID=UPI0035B5C533
MTYREKPSCTEAGKCSAKCKRSINATCSHDEQCMQGANNSICVKSANSSITGNCQCDQDYWAYSATRCIHKISYSGFVWSWINKRIVNSMCNVTFTVKAPQDFQIRLMNNPDFNSGVQTYMIRIGYTTNTKTRLDRAGTLISEVSTPAILTNNFQNFTLSWCNGIINVGRQGQPPVLSYTDPLPIKPITGIGFYSVAPNNHIFFPHNLVDPYFPTSESTGVVRTNGHDYHKVKLLPSGAPTTSINFTFECKAPRDCNVIFGQLSNDYPYYKIIYGSFANTRVSFWGSVINNWIKEVAISGIVSGTEFRKFWISIEGRTFKIGKGDDPTPIINWTESFDVNFTHVSINSYDGDLGYFKILSHRQFHDYPNGGYV